MRQEARPDPVILGSPVAEYGSGATNLTVMSFDTWGLRRKSTSNAQISTSDLASYASPRGYTGHEHLDEVGLIHMNGRIYDPMIGRFLQPDPIISEPYNSQNFNRYAYVLNNPLMYTDPSGYSTWTEIRRPVAAIIVAVITYNAAMFLATEGTVGVLSLQSLGQAQFYSSIASGFASGGVAGGNIESAIAGAFSAGLFFGVGELGLGSGSIGNIAAHAAAGCVSAGVQGGSCRAGASSAGFAEFAGPRLLTGKMVVDTVVHATLGGIGSMAGGGKFGNGAVTGAFGYLFNCIAHECLAEGRDAERTFVEHLKTSGTDSKLDLQYNKWYDSTGEFFWGRPDIFSEKYKQVWDIKPKSVYGYATGYEQIDRYTTNEVYKPGGAVIMGGKATITLDGKLNSYEFQYGGNGLVFYNTLNPSRLEQQIANAARQNAQNFLSPPWGRGKDDKYGH